MKSSDSALLQALLDAARGIGIRGGYKPGGTSGAAIRQIIRQITPSMYPLSNTREQIDLDALAYCLERLPAGIEACSHIDIVRDETPYAQFPPIPVPKRREVAFRVSPEQMVLVVKGSKIRILDRISMITCLYLEGDKLANFAEKNVLNWDIFEKMLNTGADENLLYIQLARITGNPVEKLKEVNKTRYKGRLARVIHNLGRRGLDDAKSAREFMVTFSNDFLTMPTIGDVTEKWVLSLKNDLDAKGYSDAPLYFVSGNLDSFLGVLTPFYPGARSSDLLGTYERLEEYFNDHVLLGEFRQKNNQHPGILIRDNVAETGLGYQIFFLDKLKPEETDPWLASRCGKLGNTKAALVVMDYPFGDDAFYYMNDVCKYLGKRLKSVGVMGRAAVFSSEDMVCLIPRAFVRQGDPQCRRLENNGMALADFNGLGVSVKEGNMLTVLGTFLQTYSILEYFTDKNRAFGIQGLEMEGIHFINALDSADLRGWVSPRLPAHFAYYKSDNPFDSEATLAKQMNMGERIVPKYALTLALLRKVLET